MNIRVEKIATNLVAGVINNVINGRMDGEIIPYYYENILEDFGVGIAFNYDEKMGLTYNLFVPHFEKYIDLDNDDEVENVTNFLNFVDIVNEIIYIPFDALTTEFYDKVKEYQITLEIADELTQFLYDNKCIMYV